VGDHYLAYQNC